jgi:hypothetical protein
LGILLIGILFTLYGAEVWAQQTIFNVPSADILPEGQGMVQHESQFRPWRPGAFWNGTHYGVYGLGHNTEANITLFNVSAPASNNIALGIGLKTALPLLEKKMPQEELKLTLGQMIPVSLEGRGVGNWSYAHLSGRVPKLGTRLTAGVSTGTRQIFGRTTVNFIGGYEHPVTERFNLRGDWYSGSHVNGLFITGFGYKVSNSNELFCGYQIPNSRQSGRSGFVIEWAKFF